MCLFRKRCFLNDLTAATIITTVFPEAFSGKLFHAVQRQIGDIFFRATKFYFDVSLENTMIKA